MRVITIGRATTNDIVVEDFKVSRVHLQLVLNDEGIYSVVDLNTTNGTYVNNNRISGETRLNPTDIVRIGDTVIPWQEYISATESPTAVANSTMPGDFNASPANRPSHKWVLYVALCSAILLIFGGIGLFCLLNNRQPNDGSESNSSCLTEDSLRLDMEYKVTEALRLQAEADALYNSALTDQNERIRKLAASKQKEADAAKQAAEDAKKAQEAAESAKEIAEHKKLESEKAQKAAEENSRRAINEAKEAKNRVQKANQDVSAANQERDNAKESARLTATFYKEYSRISSKTARQVCERLHIKVPDKTDEKEWLCSKFDNSDNKQKQAIIDALSHTAKRKEKSNTPIEEDDDDVIDSVANDE